LINYKQIIIDENVKKQKVFAKIAHEFKTPLNSIVGLSKTLKTVYYDENNQSPANCILKQIDGLSNYVIFLINDIIEY
jgi:signal transduction histidine kinase